jgi:hypothetical protein
MKNSKISEGYERGKAAKVKKEERETEIKEAENELEVQKLFSSYLAKQLLDKNYTLNFMDKVRREHLMQLYSADPVALHETEVKPLKFSNKDKFVNTMEINLDLAANVQAK